MDENISIHDLQKKSMPRERLVTDGPSSLTDHELLAILLGTGSRNESVLQLSVRILKHFEGFRFLKDATIEELTKIKGVGAAKGIQILAAFELGRRVHRLQFDERFSIRSPEDCATYMMEEMRFLTQEHFICLYLNTKNQIIHRQTVFVGGLNSSLVHPREILKEAIRRSAASYIALHNHPSGEPSPSKEDIDITKRLVDCGKIIGIELLDHSARCS